MTTPGRRRDFGGALRVWRGSAADAMGASRWDSDEIMRRTIGDVINRHLAQIREAIKKGQAFALEHHRVGYRTGQGWVTTAKKKGESLMFYKEDLDGITIVIRARRNHVPTANDPEGWYVHTAYPDTAM